MNTLLRKLAEWKGKRKAAQVIVFDGGAEVERARSFLKGALTGIVVSTALFLVTAPDLSDPRLLEEMELRERLIRESNRRLEQAVEVANVCLNTAQQLEETLASYQSFLSGRSDGRAGPLLRTP